MAELNHIENGTGRIIESGHGRYVETPVTAGPRTLTVHAGENLRKVFILRPSSASEAQTAADPALPVDHIIVEENAIVDVCVIVLPGVNAEIPLVVDMVGTHSEVYLSGIYICGGNEKVSFSTLLNHRVADCKSRQLFNGIAGGSSVADFYGRIIVSPDAQKIEAYQENHNILLSDTARVNTKPQLEIYADDVKCSHGATVGSLNEEEQFYMRSRGIPLDEAKVLQMISFISPVLEHIPTGEESKGATGAGREEILTEIEASIRSLFNE